MAVSIKLHNTAIIDIRLYMSDIQAISEGLKLGDAMTGYGIAENRR
jgi:hypothetical protein